ncbi:Regulator of sigma-W protease RasP [Caloramator mitchellensis]|uniref:Zinc metalloprotease n=1 Tax=Caloramator mitchellensis TaxID=908809 RepID=A0A0R3JTV1_CALMK|nr:RIP metalloprotease RseP [Caloramator mitchellensis]KRQ86983.1 Regulator of sigma-W protease RasP [Caloramator mitchellensis]
MTTFLASIFVFGLLITGHELGHFALAKLNRVKVLEFAIGMGPRILKFNTKETTYSLRLFPIGGYVKMLGEEEKSSDPRAFNNQNAWRRLSILIAGAFMNFVLAIVLFMLVYYNVGVTTLTINEVVPNYPAYNQDIRVGDRIVAINDNKIYSWTEFVTFVASNKDKPFKLTIKRDNIIIDKTMTPVLNAEQNKYMIGVSTKIEKGNIAESIKHSFIETFASIKQMLVILGGLITRKVSTEQIGGPVAIVKMSGEVARVGIWNLLYFAGFLSINLGVFNLIPFPALDGGWVILTLFEGVTGRKFDENKIGLINLIGFSLLMLLAVLITYRDILRIFS